MGLFGRIFNRQQRTLTPRELAVALCQATTKGVTELYEQLRKTSGQEIINRIDSVPQAGCELWIYCAYPFYLAVQHHASQPKEIRDEFCTMLADLLFENFSYL